MRKPSSKDHSELKSSQKADLTKSPKSDSGKKPDLRARYWKFLFDNLQRAVDAIYETCEQDESALECKVCSLKSKNEEHLIRCCQCQIPRLLCMGI